MDRYEVFSIQKADGSEEIVYDPDTINEADPNVEQVRRFISGQQYGMDLYHPGWTKIGGTVAGVGSGFIGFYGPPGIFAYVLVAGKINTRKIPESAEIDPVVFNSEEFRLGYKKYTRNKIIRDGLIWGGIGFAVAFPAFYFIYHNK
ncbi:MAG: hypothetical protein IT241_10760 [Bacteroidia bacterium]|nr:hypothetical protein [Bacteroidia bacterium]